MYRSRLRRVFRRKEREGKREARQGTKEDRKGKAQANFGELAAESALRHENRGQVEEGTFYKADMTHQKESPGKTAPRGGNRLPRKLCDKGRGKESNHQKKITRIKG